MTGPIALLGSGEYLDVMNETDLLLLERVAPGRTARVALVPAASGLEPGSPERWNRLGMEHFRSLGADVVALDLVRPEDAHDAGIVDALHRADLVYFSGGNPGYLREVLAGSPAWSAILARRAQGAGVAGCSAGAMVMGGLLGGLRTMTAGQPVFSSGLGVLPGVLVLPHYDRFRPRVEAMAPGLPGAWTRVPGGPDLILGIDEDTALVWDRHHWRVTGVGVVWAYRGEAVERFRPGEAVPVPDPVQADGRG